MAKDEKVSAEQTVRDIRRQTQHKDNAEEKIRIVVEGLRVEASVADEAEERGEFTDFGSMEEAIRFLHRQI